MKLSRRGFMNTLAASVAGVPLMGFPVFGRDRWRPIVNAAGTANTMSSAKNLIFIHLRGGPSHVDTFDLKLGSWTPDALGPAAVGDLLWPQGTMPKLAQRTEMFSILRSLIAVEPVHERANYHLLTSYRQNPSTVADVPHFGSLLALLMEDGRLDHHVLPFGVALSRGVVGKGKLPIEYQLARVDDDGGVPNLNHIWPNIEERFALLNTSGDALVPGDKRINYHSILETAKTMSQNADLKAYNNDSNLPQAPTYPYFYSNAYTQQAQAGIRLLSSGLGTRVVVMDWFGWDNHNNIYSPNNGANVMNLSRAFDDAMAYLLDSLAALPGEVQGSLLDETLVVAAGEFGRTVGQIDNNAGRDHYPYVTPVFLAGGGVKGGRVIGASSENGDYVSEYGWTKNRPIGIGDLTATMYSALGCNWHSQVQYTPTGRIYDVVDSRNTGPLDHVETLFV